MRSSAVEAELALSDRIRRQWRIAAVDLDLEAAQGQKVLIAGKDLRNVGIELKHVDAGPLDLNSRQFEVLRRTRQDVPPFLFQFTAPPDHPWCFRVWALRHDALEAIGQRPYVTLTEREAEGFTMALVAGNLFTVTQVEPSKYAATTTPNRYPGNCLECGIRIAEGRGYRLRPSSGDGPWAVIHPSCQSSRPSTVELTFDHGEPAYYLAHFSDEAVPEFVWPDVIPPRSYADPPLRSAHTSQANRFLQFSGVYDRSPDKVLLPPDLVVVRTRVSALEICERNLRRARGDRRFTDADVQAAAENVERWTTGRILSSPWTDEESIRRLTKVASRLIGLRAPGPFSGGDAQRNFAEWPGFDLAEVDWHGIRAAEKTAKAKQAKLPTCRVCGRPMWLDQPGVHYQCETRR